jgi:hypothetical protein
MVQEVEAMVAVPEDPFGLQLEISQDQEVYRPMVEVVVIPIMTEVEVEVEEYPLLTILTHLLLPPFLLTEDQDQIMHNLEEREPFLRKHLPTPMDIS